MPNPSDIDFMHHALRLAARGLGRTWPNPSVGAVVVKNGVILGRAVTANGGRPHAETQALIMAGAEAKGATLYVTLEPCAHTGKTPPCTDAIIAAGISRVVVACPDPNPVARGGSAKLRSAGIEVTENVCVEEALKMNEGFFSVMKRKRPFVALKIATSQDGKITGGADRWITNEASRASGHRLRATHDAILTGVGTVLADDPALTCRLPGREKDSPQRVVLDTALRMPPHAKILPAWIFTAQATESDSHFTVASENGRLSLPDVLRVLAEKGITRLLVEGGAAITTALLSSGLADRVYWFRSPEVIGEKGLGALADGAARPPASYALASTEALEGDRLEVYELS